MYIGMKRFLILIALIAAGATAAFGVEFSIRYFDKMVYTTDSGILVKVTIKNDGPAPYRFKLADEKVFSLDFSVRTLSGKDLEHTEMFIRKRGPSQPVYFREMSVEPGEEFSFVEDLRDYVAIKDPGSYQVRASFYPELAGYEALAAPVLSNSLALSVRPGAAVPDVKLMTDAATGAILALEKLAPDAVVEYTINARQKGDWKRFFLYIDLESLLLRSSKRAASYTRESDEGRARTLELYRADLIRSASDPDIGMIPSEYAVLKTTYSGDSGEVQVLEKFRMAGFTELKLYTYYLKKKDGVWYIVDYVVVNKGTE